MTPRMPMPIYSIRTAWERELFWTTGRKAAREMAARINSLGVGALIRNGVVGYSEQDGLRDDDLPVFVRRCNVIREKVAISSEARRGE